jgi:hypothetical protein
VPARPHRHHRRRYHRTVIAQGADLPVKTIARRASFVAEGKSPVLLCQFVDQLANRLRPTGNGAKEAHFLALAALRNRNSKPLFARIKSHVGRILLHGSSPMPEALTGIARPTLDAGMQQDEPPLLTTDMGSHHRRNPL